MTDEPGLAVLLEAITRDFQRLSHPPAQWVPERQGPDGRPMADVAIIGAGMNGLAAAFALRRLGIGRIWQVDRAPPGYEGPWLTYARMQTLRSPKHLPGPVLGLPNLTFRAWFEAKGGPDAWERLGRIPREMWAEYLVWYRLVTGAAVENLVEVTGLTPSDGGVAVEFRHPDGRAETVHARQAVLATGREGQAVPRVPAPLRAFLGGLVRHSSEQIDFGALAGRRVAVVGLAASAVDNAATALDAGAAKVVLIGRARAMPRLNKMKQTVYPGFTHGFPDLPDAEKLKFLSHVASRRIAPPRDSVLRISADPRMRLMLGAEVTGATPEGAGLRLETSAGSLGADLVVLGTGFAFDLDTHPEIAAFSHRVLRWGDRVPETTGDWAASPYLGRGFEFLEREPGAAPGLRRVRCFTHAAQLSLGNLANDIPAAGEAADRLATAIARDLFLEDRAMHFGRLEAYNEPELLGDEWPGLQAWDPPVG